MERRPAELVDLLRWAVAVPVAITLSLVLGLALSPRRLGTHEAEPSATHTKSACEVEVDELARWLATVGDEGELHAELLADPAREHHYLDRPRPSIPLVWVEARASAPAHLALVTLNARVARFGDLAASPDDERALRALSVAATSSGLSYGFGVGGLGHFTMIFPVEVEIGKDELWEDTAKLADSLARAGFTELYLSFEVTSRAAKPAPSRALETTLRVARDNSLMPWQREEAVARELAAATQACPELTRALTHAGISSVTAEQTRDFIEHTAERLRGCACHADLDAIRAFTWARLGRHWGPLLVSYRVDLPAKDRDAPFETVHSPAKARWAETYQSVLDVAKRGYAVSFAVD